MDNEALNRSILLDEIRSLREKVQRLEADIEEIKYEWEESCTMNPNTNTLEVPVNVVAKIDGILRGY